MKHIFLVLFAVGFAILTNAQTQYEVSSDGTNKILKGILSRDLLEKDSTFTWCRKNRAGYIPNELTVSALRKNRSQVQLIVFGGTWCDDSKNILPKLFSLLDAASFPTNHLTIVGVDHQNRSISNLSEQLHIEHVPTLIVFKDGKEAGRIIDYGKEGHWDQELGDLVNDTRQ
jgi:thiol-disulfide isomerase/thioredoxin